MCNPSILMVSYEQHLTKKKKKTTKRNRLVHKSMNQSYLGGGLWNLAPLVGQCRRQPRLSSTLELPVDP